MNRRLETDPCFTVRIKSGRIICFIHFTPNFGLCRAARKQHPLRHHCRQLSSRSQGCSIHQPRPGLAGKELWKLPNCKQKDGFEAKHPARERERERECLRSCLRCVCVCACIETNGVAVCALRSKIYPVTQWRPSSFRTRLAPGFDVRSERPQNLNLSHISDKSNKMSQCSLSKQSDLWCLR